MTDPVLEIERLSLSIGNHPILKDVDLSCGPEKSSGLSANPVPANR